MTPDAILTLGSAIAGTLLMISMVGAAIRIVRGPTGPDRVVALDMLGILGVAAAGLAGVYSGSPAFIDIALGVALVGFLAAIAFAGFIEKGSIHEEGERQ